MSLDISGDNEVYSAMMAAWGEVAITSLGKTVLISNKLSICSVVIYLGYTNTRLIIILGTGK